MTKANSKKSGSCLCGAVAFEIDGPLGDVVCCHCSQCRKQTGHVHATTQAEKKHLHMLREDGLAWYHATPGARRGFCSKCGSTLFWEELGRDDVAILAGALDAPTGLKTVKHIFVADKGDYYELNDGLPQYQQVG